MEMRETLTLDGSDDFEIREQPRPRKGLAIDQLMSSGQRLLLVGTESVLHFLRRLEQTFLLLLETVDFRLSSGGFPVGLGSQPHDQNQPDERHKKNDGGQSPRKSRLLNGFEARLRLLFTGRIPR